MRPLPMVWMTTVYLLLGAAVIHDLNGHWVTFPLVFVIIAPFFVNAYLVLLRKEKE